MPPLASVKDLRLTRNVTVSVAAGRTPVTVEDRDRTRPFVLLHGGGGPRTMSGFADLLAERTHSRVLLPTHPGFAGTPRPEELGSTRDLAAMYVDLVERLDLSDVTLVGNSFGGWLAAEIALLGSPRVSGAVIVDGIGVEIPGHPVTDVSGLSPTEITAISWHDSSKIPVAPAGAPAPSPDLPALLAYTGPQMADPTLLGRLRNLDLPVHVVWGESDGIVDPGYGRAYAAAIPGSSFTLLPGTGHLPQLETPQELFDAIWERGRDTLRA
ncbi:alpha/beta fold hydrolase [Promicromonospora sp. NPDC057488]|uniref:alpha/beta fold hydrolase n=1 Tax=Promicromonospora sp. NPDC057488 TaxID=3346147 RepID=UPI00366B82B4